MTHNLSEGKNHEPWPYPRGSVRRASGFVLTGKQEVTDYSLFADDFAGRFERGKLSLQVTFYRCDPSSAVSKSLVNY